MKECFGMSKEATIRGASISVLNSSFGCWHNSRKFVDRYTRNVIDILKYMIV